MMEDVKCKSLKDRKYLTRRLDKKKVKVRGSLSFHLPSESASVEDYKNLKPF